MNGRSSFAGKDKHRVRGDLDALLCDQPVVEVEEVEGAASLGEADLRVGLADVSLENDLHVALAQEGRTLRADPRVQNDRSRLGDQEQDHLVETDHRRQQRSDANSVPGEVGLGEDLSEQRDPDGAEGEGAHPCHNRVAEKSEKHVDADVSPEDRAQEEVRVLAQAQDSLRRLVAAFRLRLEAQPAD